MKTLLIIDIEEIGEMLKEEIEALYDLKVITRYSVNSAKEYLVNNNPDFIICDNYQYDLPWQKNMIFYTGNLLSEIDNTFYKPTETSVLIDYLFKTAS